VGYDIGDLDRTIDELIVTAERTRFPRPVTEPLASTPIEAEPSVMVDTDLCVEQPRLRYARGTSPPPTCIGAYCVLDHDACDVSGEIAGPEISESDGLPLVVADE
jgi:hypothetical protein